jgi:7-cyano-7-deazaguanine reductase
MTSAIEDTINAAATNDEPNPPEFFENWLGLKLEGMDEQKRGMLLSFAWDRYKQNRVRPTIQQLRVDFKRMVAHNVSQEEQRKAFEKANREQGGTKLGITKLGERVPYQLHSPNVAMLETFPNPAKNPYLVEHTSAEFTSLCPKTGQPDFGTILIQFEPHLRCVESKSLKLYLFAYRNTGAFMEQIVNQIRDDLVEAMEPLSLIVRGEFKPRGGILTVVTAKYAKEQDETVTDA